MCVCVRARVLPGSRDRVPGEVVGGGERGGRTREGERHGGGGRGGRLQGEDSSIWPVLQEFLVPDLRQAGRGG